MAVAVAQEATPFAYATVSSFTMSLTGVGSTSVLVLAANINSGTISGITDNAATPYTWSLVERNNPYNNYSNAETWIGKGGSGGSVTVTVTNAGSHGSGAYLYELTGCGPTPVQSALATAVVASSLTGPTNTPTSAGCLVFVSAVGGYGWSSVPSTPWVTDESLSYAAATYQSGVTSGSNYTTSWGGDGTGDYCAIGIVFQPSSSPSYTVTFNANGGTGSLTAETDSSATALSLFSTGTMAYAGYMFTGWNTIAGGGGTAYADGASYPFTSSVTLYAQWAVTTNITRASGFPVETAESGGTNVATQAVTWVTVGDWAILFVNLNYTGAQPSVATVSATKTGTWIFLGSDVDPIGPPYHDLEFWAAPITSIGADTVSITYSGTTTYCDVVVDEMHSPLGSPDWGATAVGALHSTGSGTGATLFDYPSVTSGGSGGQAYLGYAAVSGSGSAGSTPGFTYTILPTSQNPYVFDGTCSPSTAYQPTAYNTDSGGTPVERAAGVIITDTSSVVAVHFAGTSACLSGSSGALGVTDHLAGSTTSLSGSSGTLHDTVAIRGSSASLSSASGAITVKVTLAGQSASLSSGSGALNVKVAISGASPSNSGASGTLTVVAPASFAGSSSSNSSGSGSLTATESIAGASASLSGATGSIRTGTLSGSSGSLSASSGTLIAKAALTGSSASISGASGFLTDVVVIAGSSASKSSSSGALTVIPAASFAGSSGSLSGATGVLSDAVAIAGESSSVSGSSGSLTVVSAASIVGTSSSVSADSGSLTVLAHLSGSASSNSGNTGTLTASTTLAGVTGSTSAANGSLSVADVLAGASAALSGDNGALTVPDILSGRSASTSGASGLLTYPVALSGTSASVSGGSGTLTVTYGVGGTFTMGGRPRTSWAIGSASVKWSSRQPQTTWHIDQPTTQ